MGLYSYISYDKVTIAINIYEKINLKLLASLLINKICENKLKIF